MAGTKGAHVWRSILHASEVNILCWILGPGCCLCAPVLEQPVVLLVLNLTPNEELNQKLLSITDLGL